MSKFGTLYLGVIRAASGEGPASQHRYTIEAQSIDGRDTMIVRNAQPSRPVYDTLSDASLAKVGDPVLLIKRFDGTVFVYPWLTYEETENCP
jgi:hypothetical protein